MSSGTPQPTDNSLSLVYGRNFSTFGLRHKIHCVPVDEVRGRLSRAKIHLREREQRQERRYDEVNDVLRQLLGNTVLPPGFRLDSLEDPEVLECGYGKGAWIDDLLKENDQLDIEVRRSQGTHWWTSGGHVVDTDHPRLLASTFSPAKAIMAMVTTTVQKIARVKRRE